ncbi:hypothetical protein CCM_02733 [Cordyceps militaris CM01]|uniref:Uncharacterized protein n=1 Tax=Cordyceps militaris (strain CM01) TaxID=983644 RepID=G3JBF5_CORMM|nr:uncharacterized protein CCM_02733 [Cordyceps militaris CM01]EGX94462.1 hypothetical protein CCM_02733 [Cordyceps militaris CM01]
MIEKFKRVVSAETACWSCIYMNSWDRVLEFPATLMLHSCVGLSAGEKLPKVGNNGDGKIRQSSG